MRIGLVAGETSGDSLGAGLMREIKKSIPMCILRVFLAQKWKKLAIIAWARSNELSVMGIIEPIKRLPHLILLRKRILKKWLKIPHLIYLLVLMLRF